MMTTAQYRAQAAQCEAALDWSQAAIYYDKAADAYPKHHPGSHLAKSDIEALRRRARSCRHMYVSENDLCGFRAASA